MATAAATQAKTMTQAPAPSPSPSPSPAPPPNPGGGGSGGGGSGPPPGGGGGGGPPPGAGAGGQPAQLPIFALSPALVSNAVLDYTDVGSIKLYYRAVEPMENLFDVEPAGLKMFLENVRKKAVSFNWMNTITIMVNGSPSSLVDEYGVITMADVLTHAQIYNGQHVRDAQNSLQIYNCLSASLTEGGMARTSLHSAEYTLNGITDGVLFLKIIIRLSHIDTRATVTVIRTRLSSLDHKIVELQDDIVAFNEHVRLQRLSLEARGERTLDLLVNLFKGYKAVADAKFVAYIGRKEDSYNEGTDISENALMDLAEAKYQIMLENGEWKAQTMEQKKIVALTQQLHTIQHSQHQTPEKRTPGKPEEQKGTGKGKTPWYYIKPKDGEGKTKTMNSKTYNWCVNHGEEGKWVIHTPAECQAKGKGKGDADKSPKGKVPGALKVSYAAITEDTDYDDDDDEF
jgi:hypothetical protein